MPPRLVLKKPKNLKEEGSIYVTNTGKLYLSPKIDALSIIQILENKYIKEGLDKMQRVMFQDDIEYQVIDNETEEPDPDLSAELRNMCVGVSFDFMLQRAWRDAMEWGAGFLSPGWYYEGAEYRLQKINRLPPETFQWRGTTYALVTNRILKGICMNNETQETEYWQKQPDGGITQLTNIYMLNDPLSSELGGTPFIIPIFPYVKMVSYAWQRQMQKVNQWGSGGLWTIKVTNPQGDDKEFAQNFINNQSSTNKYQLRENMEIINLGGGTEGSALETINEIGMVIRQFFTPANLVGKEGTNLIGGSNSTEYDLYMSYIKGTHRWLERAARLILDPWLMANGYAEKYRLEVDIPLPKIDEAEKYLKIAREGKLAGTITDIEHRDMLNTAGADLDEMTEAEMATLKEERMAAATPPPSPFGQQMQKAETLAKVIAANPLDPYALAGRDKARDFIQKTLLEEGDAVPFPKSRPHLSGGSGSGNFGHEGRPGEVGGSGEGSTTAGKTDTPALRKQDTQATDISVKTISSGKGRGRAVDFDERPQDLAKYRNAPDNGAAIMSMPQVVEVREQLKEQGRLNPDGRTVSYWHVTDADSADSIKEKGLVPGYHEAIGQEWKATHSDYGTYFFGDKDTAVASLKEVIELTQIPDSYVLVEAKIPVTPKSLLRILPDEDVSPDTTKYKQALLRGDSIAYIGGIPAHAVTVHRVAEYEKPHKQGGAGSGNFDHAGRPGEVGGSSSDGGGGSSDEKKSDLKPPSNSENKTFDAKVWQGKRDEWKALSVSERDRLADAKTSVQKYQQDIVAPLGEWHNTPDIRRDVAERIGSAQNDLDTAGANRIELATAGYIDTLERAGVGQESARMLMTLATDSLIAQEVEAQNRQLGDHGAHHITGDIDRGMTILQQVPGEDTAEQEAILYTAAVFHDSGYMTEPSRSLLDEGHPRWSQQHYDENIAPTVEKVLGKEASREISGMIRTHDTSTIDWDEDPVGSALRVADNTSLFEQDKLPPVFRNVDGNTNALFEFAEGRADLPQLKSWMRSNIEKSDIPDRQKARYYKATDEVGEKTAKYTLGMMGGSLNSITWREDHIVLGLREQPDMTRFHNIMDLGQSQFGKLAESYGQDPATFTKTLDFKFKNTAGKTVLEGVMVKTHRQGGAGSGNFDHSGRPGEVGGSAPADGGGSAEVTTVKKGGMGSYLDNFIRNPKTGQYEKVKRGRDASGKFKKKEEEKEDGTIPAAERAGVMDIAQQEVLNQMQRFVDPTPQTAEKWQEYLDKVKTAPSDTPPEEIKKYLETVEKERQLSNPGIHLEGVPAAEMEQILKGLAPLEQNGIKVREISVMQPGDPSLVNPEGVTGAYYNEAGNCIRINPMLLKDNGLEYHNKGNAGFKRWMVEQEKRAMILDPSEKADRDVLIKATKGWSVITRDDLPADKYLEATLNHESWHAVDKTTHGSDALMFAEVITNVGQKELLGVSIYAMSGGKDEAWAECNSAIDMGLSVPIEIRTAVGMAKSMVANRGKGGTTKVVSI